MLNVSGALARAAVVVCMLAMAACAGGGSGGGGSSGGGGGGGSGGGGGGSSGGGGGGGSGGTGGIGSPSSATAGTNPAPSQLASVGGPGFGSGPHPPNGTIFPLTQSVMRANATTASPDSNVMSGGATITINANNVTLKIPSLGIDTAITGDGVPVSDNGYSVYLAIGSGKYYFGGVWGAERPPTAILSHFVGGYETPANRVPSTGQATYDRTPTVVGVLYTPNAVYVLSGTGSFSANFASGAITGDLHGFTKTDPNTNNTQFWGGTITISAQITSGTSKVTGTTGFIPGDTFSASANGTFRGGFYGPDGEELAGVWTLSDGTNAAIGTAGIETGVPGGSSEVTDQLYSAAQVQSDYIYPNQPGSSIGAPAPAASHSGPALLATPGGPTLNGSGSAPPASTEFPLTFTSLKFSPNAISADTAAISGGATLVGDRLIVPGADIDTHIPVGVPYNFANGSGGGSSTLGHSIDISIFGLSYVGFGLWQYYAPEMTPNNAGAFIFGYQTPTGAVPSTGSATYSAQDGVIGSVFVLNTYGAAVGGDVSLTANFGTGTVTGTFSNMHAFDKFVLTPWNTVSVSAHITGNRFSGTTGVTSAPSGPFALGGNATGDINGGFYGPNAENLGAVWSLSDGNRAAIGWVGAPKQ